jgi:hypothetical protein
VTTPEGPRLRLSVDDEGSVVLGDAAPPGPLTASLLVDGGVLTVDLLDPTATPAVIVGDVRAGRRWIDDMLGDQVGQAIQAAVDGDEPAAQVTATPTAAWTHAAELAVARWVRRRHPGTRATPIPDLALLDLQIGHLTFLADTVVGDDAQDRAAALIEGHLDRLAGEVESGLDHPPTDPTEDRVQRILQDVLVTAVQIVDTDPYMHTRLDDLLDALRLRELVERDFADQVIKTLTAAPAPVLVMAPTTGSLDWEQLPPWVFRTDEGTVTWDVENGTVTVEVTGVLDPTAVRGLRVRLYTPGRLVPVAVADLTVEGTVAYAELPLPPTAPRRGLIVDVYDPSLARPVRLGTAARYAAAERQAIRVVAGLRAGALSPDLAAQAIDQTVSDLARLPEWSGTGRDIDLARRLRRFGDHVAVDPTPPWPATAAELRLR